MNWTLRDYQLLAVEDACAILHRNGVKIYAAPTGTGKSLIELTLLEMFPDAWLVTPRVEIIADMLRKLDWEPRDFGCGSTELLGEQERMITPIRLRNRLLSGEMKAPSHLILDEAHHDLASSWQDIHALCGHCGRVGFTATPYRGTPKGTAAFRELWGEPTWIISYPESVAAGYLAFPNCSVWPLVDDDTCELSNGEFVIASVEDVTRSRLAAIADRCMQFAVLEGDKPHWTWDRPTMFSLPSTALSNELALHFATREIPVNVVTQDTSAAARREAFADCIDCTAALIQIQVVSEGVDLPIRRLIDIAPSISPVRWLQQVGRITRPVKPGEESPEYIATNRNLLRHAYLLEGCLPQSMYVEAQAAFVPSSGRVGMRAVGLEAIGRLQPAPFDTTSGVRCSLYCVSTIENNTKVEYAAILHPLMTDPIWCVKESPSADGARTYGKWRKCESPVDLKGFASLPGSNLSEKQAAWWNRSATRVGLKVDQKVTRKNFAILPILSDIGGKLS